MTAVAQDDPIDRLAELADANIEIAHEIQLLLDQALAERALDQAATKTRTLIDNVTEARRLVTEYQSRPSPQTPETP